MSWKNAPQQFCYTSMQCSYLLQHIPDTFKILHAQNAASCICDDAQTYCMHLWDPKAVHAPMMYPKCYMHPLLLHMPVMPKNTVTCICDDAHTLHSPITNQSVLQQAPMMPRKMLLHTATMLQNCCNMCLWLPKRCMHLLLLQNYAHINYTPNYYN